MLVAACPLGTFIYMLMMPPLCSQWIMGSKYRAKLRKKYGLVEAPYEDVVSHIFCPCCSLCQEFRELKNRGLDPALGKKQPYSSSFHSSSITLRNIYSTKDPASLLSFLWLQSTVRVTYTKSILMVVWQIFTSKNRILPVEIFHKLGPLNVEMEGENLNLIAEKPGPYIIRS